MSDISGFWPAISMMMRASMQTPLTGLMEQAIILIFCSIIIIFSAKIHSIFYDGRVSLATVVVLSCIICGIAAYFLAKAINTIAAG